MSLTYNHSRHEYKDGERRLFSATEVLAGVHVYDNSGPWFKDPKYRQRGDAISTACRYLFEGCYDESGTHPEIVPYVRQVQDFLRVTGFRPRIWEAAFALPQLGFAGRFDLGGVLDDGITLVETKSGSVPVMVGCQLALYELLVRQGERIRLREDQGSNWFSSALKNGTKLQRRCLQLTPEKWTLHSSVKGVPLDNPQWDVTARSALNVFNSLVQFGVKMQYEL